MIDYIKIYKDCKNDNRSDEEIIDYMEYLESIENCNMAHKNLGDIYELD